MHSSQTMIRHGGHIVDLPGCFVMWKKRAHHWLSMPNVMGVAAFEELEGVLH